MQKIENRDIDEGEPAEGRQRGAYCGRGEYPLVKMRKKRSSSARVAEAAADHWIFSGALTLASLMAAAAMYDSELGKLARKQVSNQEGGMQPFLFVDSAELGCEFHQPGAHPSRLSQRLGSK